MATRRAILKSAAATSSPTHPGTVGLVVHATGPAYFFNKHHFPTSIHLMDDIDLDHIETLGGFGSPELVKILSDFLDSLEKQAGELLSCLKNADRDAFRESAHRLKGAAQMSGFPKLGKLAATWENLAQNDSDLPEEVQLESQLSSAIQAARLAFSNHTPS